MIPANEIKNKRTFREENKRKENGSRLGNSSQPPKTKETASSRDLHDNVGSQLTHIISQLDYTSNLLPVLTRRPMIKFKYTNR